MESNEKKILDKADFYRTNEIKAHVLTVPKGTFKNGLFVSGLEDNRYFWFIELDTSIPIRLFLSEIHDIEEYVPEEIMGNEKNGRC
jgi:hypothetical protein